MVEKATMESKTKATMWKSIKTDSETGVQNDFTFCLEPPIEKTNSERFWDRKLKSCDVTFKR